MQTHEMLTYQLVTHDVIIEMVRLRRLELPRGISPTATSTLRVYQFRHSRTKVLLITTHPKGHPCKVGDKAGHLSPSGGGLAVPFYVIFITIDQVQSFGSAGKCATANFRSRIQL